MRAATGRSLRNIVMKRKPYLRQPKPNGRHCRHLAPSLLSSTFQIRLIIVILCMLSRQVTHTHTSEARSRSVSQIFSKQTCDCVLAFPRQGSNLLLNCTTTSSAVVKLTLQGAVVLLQCNNYDNITSISDTVVGTCRTKMQREGGEVRDSSRHQVPLFLRAGIDRDPNTAPEMV